MVSFLSKNPGVQSSASLALAVMSENLSSRDVVGKLGKSVVALNTEEGVFPETSVSILHSAF